MYVLIKVSSWFRVIAIMKAKNVHQKDASERKRRTAPWSLWLEGLL